MWNLPPTRQNTQLQVLDSPCDARLCNACNMDKKQPEGEPQGRFAEVKKKAAEQRALKNRQARENAERNAARIAKENEGREP
jgi:hypothetical protein